MRSLLSRFPRRQMAALALSLAGFAALAVTAAQGDPGALDVMTLQTLHGFASPALDQAMIAVSFLGSIWFLFPAVVLATLAISRKIGRPQAWFFALAAAGARLANLGVKVFFARPRPSLWASVAPEGEFSFPSGHAMCSMAIWLALLIVLAPTKWRRLALFGGAAYVVLIGLSRLYLGVHYPSDVAAGWLAGAAFVAALAIPFARRA